MGFRNLQEKYLLSLGSSNLFAKSMCLLLWCLLMSKATFGYLLGYIKASKSKLHQSKYSPRTHSNALRSDSYNVLCNAASFCAMHFLSFRDFFFIFRILGKNPKPLLQFLEKLLLQFLEKTFLQFLGKYFLERSKHLIIVMFKVSMRPNPIVEFYIQNSN